MPNTIKSKKEKYIRDQETQIGKLPPNYAPTEKVIIDRVRLLEDKVKVLKKELEPQPHWTEGQQISYLERIDPWVAKEYQTTIKEYEDLTNFYKDKNELKNLKLDIDRFKPKVWITLNGKNIQKFNKIAPDFIDRIVVKENDGGATDSKSKMGTVEITFKNPLINKGNKQKYAFEGFKPFLTKAQEGEISKEIKSYDYLEIIIGYDNEKRNFGKFYVDRPKLNFAETNAPTIILKGITYEENLNTGEKYRVWWDKTPEDIVNQIAKEANLSVNIEPTGIPRKTIVQNTSDYLFLKKIAYNLGYLLYIERNILYFHSIGNTDPALRGKKFNGYKLEYRPNSKGTLSSFRINSFESKKFEEIIGTTINDTGRLTEPKKYDVTKTQDPLSLIQNKNNISSFDFEKETRKTELTGFTKNDEKIKDTNKIKEKYETISNDELATKYKLLFGEDSTIPEIDNLGLLTYKTRQWYVDQITKYEAGELSENEFAVTNLIARQEIQKRLIVGIYDGKDIVIPGTDWYQIPAEAYIPGMVSFQKRISYAEAIKNEEELNKLLKAKAIQKRFAVKATGKTIGLPNLKPRNIVDISGTGDFDQYYYITDITHTFDQSGYNISFDCVSVGRKIPVIEVDEILNNQDLNEVELEEEIFVFEKETKTTKLKNYETKEEVEERKKRQKEK